MCSRRSCGPIDGLERAEIVRPGYAVEYEFVDPRRLNATLEVRDLPGCSSPARSTARPAMRRPRPRGWWPGLNAAALRSTWPRCGSTARTSYIGVMIDDLTLQGVSEPYRMMTARAEYRLSLRADNATTRLGEAALAAGACLERRRGQIEGHFELRGDSAWAEPTRASADALYAPYVERQRREWDVGAARRARLDPGRPRLCGGSGLSNEMVERLAAARPETLDQASRVPGVTPAALSALYVAASRRAAA